MEHKKFLSNQEKQQKIQLLKKQRDGLVIGSYGNTLAELYNKINSIISENNQCSIKMIHDNFSIINAHEKNIIIDYCLDLEQLGYITINDNEQIQILKKIDF